MPKATFFNLPNSKRNTIIQLAIAEFANHDYANASISRVVAQAKIAKGSFYQYFQDKKDLCLYLVELATEEKIAFLRSTNPPELKQGFFPYLRWLMSASARFDLSHPKLSQVVYRAIYGQIPFQEEALQRTKEISLDYIQQLVKKGIVQGDIDASVDPDLVAFMINTLGNELGQFILSRMGVSPQQVAQEGPLDVDMQELETIFDEFIQILQFGLSANKA